MGRDGLRWVEIGRDGSRWVGMGRDAPSAVTGRDGSRQVEFLQVANCGVSNFATTPKCNHCQTPITVG